MRDKPPQGQGSVCLFPLPPLPPHSPIPHQALFRNDQNQNQNQNTACGLKTSSLEISHRKWLVTCIHAPVAVVAATHHDRSRSVNSNFRCIVHQHCSGCHIRSAWHSHVCSTADNSCLDAFFELRFLAKVFTLGVLTAFEVELGVATTFFDDVFLADFGTVAPPTLRGRRLLLRWCLTFLRFLLCRHRL